MLPLPKSLLEAQGKPVWIVPCTVTQVSPLLVDMLGGTGLPGVSIAGATWLSRSSVGVTWLR